MYYRKCMKKCAGATSIKIIFAISIILLLTIISSCSKPTKSHNIVIKLEATQTEGLPPLEVLLDASSSYDKAGESPLRFVWEFPNGSTFEGPTVLKGFEEPGVYTVRLKVSNGVNTATQEIKITVKPIPLENVREYQLTDEPSTIDIDGTLRVTPPSGLSGGILKVAHLSTSPQPACSPFTLIDVWKINLDVPTTPFYTTGKFAISFAVPAEVTDPIIIEWLGDFWGIAENEGGLPGGTFDPLTRTISLERAHFSIFALAKIADPILKALEKVPDVPPKPIFSYTVEGLAHGEIAVNLTVISPNLMSFSVRGFDFGFGGMWYCIDFQKGDDKITVTWDQPPVGVQPPLLRPGVTQKARVILPETGGTFTVCLRPGCEASFNRALLDWLARLGLPLENNTIAAMIELVEKLWETAEKWEKLKAWNFSDIAKDLIKFAAKLVYSLTIKTLQKANPYIFALNAVPVAGDIVAFILGVMKNKMGIEPDPCWTVRMPPVPTIVTETLPSGNVGKSYEATLEVKGGEPPYSWLIVTGNLPTGLVLGKESGKITGTPKAEGTWKFAVKVADRNGLSTQKTFEINIGSSAVQPRPLEVAGEYVLFGKSEEGETILKLDKTGKFTITAKGDYMTVVLAQGTYRQLSQEFLLFDLVPGVMQVKAQILPNGNAIVGTLTLLSFMGEVWIKRGVPIPRPVDIVGTYKKLDSTDKYISITLSQNWVILTITSSQQKCAYLCVYVPEDRDLEIRGFAPGSERRECDLLLTSSISWLFVIDNEYIYTYSLLDEKWTGIWEKMK